MSQIELVSSKEELYSQKVEFLAMDLTKNELPELYPDSLDRFPSHLQKSKILLFECQNVRRSIVELDPYHLESSKEIYEFIKPYVA